MQGCTICNFVRPKPIETELARLVKCLPAVIPLQPLAWTVGTIFVLVWTVQKVRTILHHIRTENDAVTAEWFREHEYREGQKGDGDE